MEWNVIHHMIYPNLLDIWYLHDNYSFYVYIIRDLSLQVEFLHNVYMVYLYSIVTF